MTTTDVWRPRAGTVGFALTNLAKVPYGRRAAAGLVDITRFRLPAPQPRWLPRSHIAEVLAQLTPGSPESRTAVRLRLMHWTGMRPSQMGRLREEDFRFRAGTGWQNRLAEKQRNV